MPEPRRPFVAGNWKMNPAARADAVALVGQVARDTMNTRGSVDLGVFPAFTHLDAVCETLREADALADAGAAPNGGWSGLAVGAQDLYFEPEGAFTGEVSAAMLKDLGVSMILAGHSERRHVIGETDETVNRKLRAAVDHGMLAILCIGETLEQREAGETDAVNERQLRAGLSGIDPDTVGRLTIAYEPVWAIGTGRTATPDDAQSAHARVREVVADIFDADAAARVRVQYGGSMKPANAADLLAKPDIDGGLIGGASLKPADFAAIASAAGGVAAH